MSDSDSDLSDLPPSPVKVQTPAVSTLAEPQLSDQTSKQAAEAASFKSGKRPAAAKEQKTIKRQKTKKTEAVPAPGGLTPPSRQSYTPDEASAPTPQAAVSHNLFAGMDDVFDTDTPTTAETTGPGTNEPAGEVTAVRPVTAKGGRKRKSEIAPGEYGTLANTPSTKAGRSIKLKLKLGGESSVEASPRPTPPLVASPGKTDATPGSAKEKKGKGKAVAKYKAAAKEEVADEAAFTAESQTKKKGRQKVQTSETAQTAGSSEDSQMEEAIQAAPRPVLGDGAAKAQFAKRKQPPKGGDAKKARRTRSPSETPTDELSSGEETGSEDEGRTRKTGSKAKVAELPKLKKQKFSGVHNKSTDSAAPSPAAGPLKAGRAEEIPSNTPTRPIPGPSNRSTNATPDPTTGAMQPKMKKPAAPQPAPRQSLLQNTLKALQSGPEKKAPGKKAEPKKVVDPNVWEMDEKQKEQYAESKATRDREREERAMWRLKAVNHMASKDAWKLDQTRIGRRPIPQEFNGMPLGIRARPSVVVRALFGSAEERRAAREEKRKREWETRGAVVPHVSVQAGGAGAKDEAVVGGDPPPVEVAQGPVEAASLPVPQDEGVGSN